MHMFYYINPLKYLSLLSSEINVKIEEEVEYNHKNLRNI